MAALLGRHIKVALHQIHSIAGLVLALLLAVIALTGAIMSFEDEIVDHLNAGIMQVAPRQAPALMPDELVARLTAAQDVGKVSAVTLASDPSAAVHVRFARDERGARPSSLYVDPYDARALGAPRGEEFFATVRKLHRWLLIPGDAKGWGRQITGVAALGLIVMLISGLVLRWPRRAGSVKMWLNAQSRPQRTRPPSLAARGDRHLGLAGLSGDDADGTLVFVRLVQGRRRLAAVAAASRCR
ncbi:putative iron-regulated membrane protein [Bradyrhizobium sp. USDA 3650]